MSQVRLTKNELRLQQDRLKQLKRYLPTLQLKKSLLQTEVNIISAHVEKLKKEFEKERSGVEKFSSLLSSHYLHNLFENLHVEQVVTQAENIAGVEVPNFEDVIFTKFDYTLFDTPIWWDSAIEKLQAMLKAKEQVHVAEQKCQILEHELREVSIRVNLFEKILIPRTEANIKKIRIFLGDQQLAAVAQAKVAKSKIIKRKQEAQI